MVNGHDVEGVEGIHVSSSFPTMYLLLGKDLSRIAVSVTLW